MTFPIKNTRCKDICPNPLEMAKACSIILSGDKGIPNEIQGCDETGYNVVTDEGDAFYFHHTGENVASVPMVKVMVNAIINATTLYDTHTLYGMSYDRLVARYRTFVTDAK